MPRSIVGWFAICWGVFLAGAVAVAIMLVALYKETTSQRTARAAAGLLRACEAIGRDPTGVAGPDAPGVARALAGFAGVEGGLWSQPGGFRAYAFPTYEGSGRKTDLPQAEEPSILAVAAGALASGHPEEWRRESSSQTLLITACPVRSSPGTIAWAMTRVATVGGRAFLLAASALALLVAVLVGSALLLGRVLWRWSMRLKAIEDALASGNDADLPQVEATGQRDLDRIVAAINGAGLKAAVSRRRSEQLAAQVSENERLAALGRVAAGVAHEIRNPIAAMRLKAENALARPEDRARTESALNIVVEQVSRMDQLLQDLVHSVQRPHPRRRKISDLRELLAQRALLFREQAGRRRIEVACVAPLPIALDFDQIGRALDNLLLNAIQNSADGTTITLSADRSGDRLRLVVRDHGAGVPAELRTRLFEPFATGRADGTGLGLAIVREIAQAHGGHATFEPHPDGSSFVLELPMNGALACQPS